MRLRRRNIENCQLRVQGIQRLHPYFVRHSNGWCSDARSKRAGTQNRKSLAFLNCARSIEVHSGVHECCDAIVRIDNWQTSKRLHEQVRTHAEACAYEPCQLTVRRARMSTDGREPTATPCCAKQSTHTHTHIYRNSFLKLNRNQNQGSRSRSGTRLDVVAALEELVELRHGEADELLEVLELGLNHHLPVGVQPVHHSQ